MAEKLHVSKIKKSISRKISTAQFESLDIHLEIEENVEWDTPEERMEKTENYTKLLIVDFMKTLDKVATTLGVDKKVAVINKSTVSNPVVKKILANQESKKASDKFNFDEE